MISFQNNKCFPPLFTSASTFIVIYTWPAIDDVTTIRKGNIILKIFALCCIVWWEIAFFCFNHSNGTALFIELIYLSFFEVIAYHYVIELGKVIILNYNNYLFMVAMEEGTWKNCWWWAKLTAKVQDEKAQNLGQTKSTRAKYLTVSATLSTLLKVVQKKVICQDGTTLSISVNRHKGGSEDKTVHLLSGFLIFESEHAHRMEICPFQLVF